MRRAFCLLLVSIGLLSACAPRHAASFAVYLPGREMTVAEIASADLQSLPLQDTPVLSTEDIVAYTWTTHEIELITDAFGRMMAMRVPVHGLPFVACVDRQPVYWGAFWTPLSSMSFDGVTILLPLGARDRTIEISLGYPTSSFFRGSDPRASADVKQALEQAGKLR